MENGQQWHVRAEVAEDRRRRGDRCLVLRVITLMGGDSREVEETTAFVQPVAELSVEQERLFP